MKKNQQELFMFQILLYNAKPVTQKKTSLQ